LTGAFVNLLDNPYNAGKYKKDFVGYKWDLALSPDGKLFAFPWDIGPASIFYRRDLLDKAGVPSDPAKLAKLIRTWDDYIQLGKKVNDPKNQVWWIDNARGVPYIYYSHKNFFDKKMNIAVDNATTRRVLTIAQKLRNDGMDAKTSAWTDEWYTMLNQGRIATTISGCWFGGFLKSFIAKDTVGKWGIIPVPEQPLQNWGGSFLAVTRQSANPEAAWKFVEYLCADAKAQNTIMKTVDYFPALIPAWKDALYDEPDPFFGGQKTRRLWADVASSQGPFVVTPLDGVAENAFNIELDKFLDQNLDVSVTVKAMVNAIDTKTQADRKVVLRLMGNK
jgi:multiple sugar transport system substrate-binding protein